MAGLPFTQLPAADEMSPEQDIQRQIQTGRQNIQQKYTLQWETVNNNARFLGQRKHQAMLQQIDASAKQEMLEFNQQAEQQLESLRQIDRIANAGGITPQTQEKLKASRTYGREAAEAMYPKETSVMAEFGRLDEFGRDIDRQLGQFRISGPGGKPPSKLAFATPITGAIAAYRGIKRAKKGRTLQMFDPSIPAKDAKGKPIKDKYGEPVMGNWREAEPEEIERYKLLSDARRGVGMEQSKLLGGRDVKQRTVQPGTPGGTFGDKITASYKKPVIKQRQQPTATELRKRGTRAAYDKGIELGYWQ
jgi:hypothetical protein